MIDPARYSLTTALSDTVIDQFCAVYFARPDYVRKRCRWKRVLDARVGAIWVLNELTGAHSVALAAQFSKTRQTIIHSLQMAEDWRMSDKVFRKHTDAILQKIRNEIPANETKNIIVKPEAFKLSSEE